MANQSVRGVQIDVDCRLALRLDEIMLQLAYLWLASLSMMVTTGNMIQIDLLHAARGLVTGGISPPSWIKVRAAW